MRRPAAIAVALLASAALAFGAVAGLPKGDERAPVLPAKVTDLDGKTVAVDDLSRIVVLNGDLAETAFALLGPLGLGGRIVGTDTGALYPPAAAKLQNIGYRATLSAEGIISLKPTLVVGTGDGTAPAGPASVLDQLRAAGVKLLLLHEHTALNAGAVKLRELGRALGVPKRGERLAKQVEAQLKVARREVATSSTKPRVAFLYVRGPRVQLICGAGFNSSSLIVAAGGVDAGAAAGVKDCVPITPEALVAAKPDVLLLLKDGLASVGGVEGLLKIPGVAQTPAGRAKRVLAYDDLFLLGLTPRTGAALRALVHGLHPELD
jgi:iron complex transport system substrate-binding protein